MCFECHRRSEMRDKSGKVCLGFYWGFSDLHSNCTLFFRTILALVATFHNFFCVYQNPYFFLLTRCFCIFFCLPDMVAVFLPSNCLLTAFALAVHESSFLATFHKLLWSYVLSPSLHWEVVTTHLCPSLL